jgi:hypothetical protein
MRTDFLRHRCSVTPSDGPEISRGPQNDTNNSEYFQRYPNLQTPKVSSRHKSATLRSYDLPYPNQPQSQGRPTYAILNLLNDSACGRYISDVNVLRIESQSRSEPKSFVVTYVSI